MLKNSKFDVIIIGGGPGGLSAALWCADLDLNAVVIERNGEFGGQMLWTHDRIKNYPGIEAANGRELRDRFLRQVQTTEVQCITGANVIAADLALRNVGLADGKELSAESIIIATGIRRRKLGIAGEDEFCGWGILDSGVTAKDEVAGKAVVIVGGGDAALENAIILSENARSVAIVHRRSEFTARKDFLDRAAKIPSVSYHMDCRLSEIKGDDRVGSVVLSDEAKGEFSVEADYVLIRIGVEPNSAFLQGQIDMDEAGYINVDRQCATSLEGVYAIGDIANPVSPTIATAVGMGVTAAKVISRKLKKK